MVLQKPPPSSSCFSSRLLLLLLFLVLLLESVLVVDCAVSGRAIPNFPKRFRTTIQQGDRQLTRTVDLLQHRIRIEDPKAKTTTIYRGDEVTNPFILLPLKSNSSPLFSLLIVVGLMCSNQCFGFEGIVVGGPPSSVV
jgi:hypothetical protein